MTGEEAPLAGPINDDDDGNGPLLLKIDEAARELRVCERQVYRLVAAGVLESVHLGRSHRITRRSLRRAAQPTK